MRLACIHVPSFPLAAWERVDPDLRGVAAAVASGPGPRGAIVACSAEAAARGVALGQSATQATSIAGRLIVRAASPEAEGAAQAALLDAAYSCSPRVEEGESGTVYCDVGGLRRLYGSEREIALAVAGRARALGLEVAVGIAASKIAARLAAVEGSGVAVIPPGEEWRALAPLPIARLAPSPALGERLERWGIRTLGDLTALPLSAVATRLGPEGAALARRARGEDERPLAPRPLPLGFEESAALDYGIEGIEPFLFVAGGLLDRLLARLAVRGFACGDLALSLGLAGGGRTERLVSVAAPTNERKPLLALIRLHLETHPPGDAVESIRLRAVSERLRPVQLDLFRPNGPAPARLALILARLAALCGPGSVGVPAVVDSHRPDGQGVRRLGGFAVRDGPLTASPLTPNSLSLRAVRPPRPLDVFCRRERPDFVRLADAVGEGAAPYGCQGRVVTLAGPWRVEGEWWSEGAFERDYYDVQLSDGAVYRLFFDRARGRWFVDGMYD